jgi:hypothetical protein
MNDPIRSFMQELVQTVVSSVFDPNPVSFRSEHERGVRPVQKILKQPANQVYQLQRNLSRNAFLCGCLDYTEHGDIEHLIIGYGRKRGRGTDVEAIEHILGSASSVQFRQSTLENIRKHSQSATSSEIIVFHNHPPNWLNALGDNIPLASSTDRHTLLIKKYLEPIQLFRLVMGTGGIRFFLGENGFVREFTTPNLKEMLEKVFGEWGSN